jgi:hypothetical protein
LVKPYISYSATEPPLSSFWKKGFGMQRVGDAELSRHTGGTGCIGAGKAGGFDRPPGSEAWAGEEAGCGRGTKESFVDGVQKAVGSQK